MRSVESHLLHLDVSGRVALAVWPHHTGLLTPSEIGAFLTIPGGKAHRLNAVAEGTHKPEAIRAVQAGGMSPGRQIDERTAGVLVGPQTCA